MNAIHVEIRGRVQGVGFRWFVREKARALDLRGWVMNRRDGNVEVAAAGPDAALHELQQALKIGPRGAVVEGVETLAGVEAASLPKPFEIVR